MLEGTDEKDLPFEKILLLIKRHRHKHKRICVDCYRTTIAEKLGIEKDVDNDKFFKEVIYGLK